MAPRLALPLREGLSTALLAAMQGGFARLPGNMANAISKASESAKADLRNILDKSKFKRKIYCNTRSRNMANGISEAFQLVKANL